MDIILWVSQAFLALAFLGSAFYNISQSLGTRTQKMEWVQVVPRPLLRSIGACEILGAIGLIVPAATHILPWLTIAAAFGLALLMVFAALFHVSRREYHHLLFPLVLLILTIFVLYGRLLFVPLT